MSGYQPNENLIPLIKQNGNSSKLCVSTTVWLHHLEFNETLGEKARRELN